MKNRLDTEGSRKEMVSQNPVFDRVNQSETSSENNEKNTNSLKSF